MATKKKKEPVAKATSLSPEIGSLGVQIDFMAISRDAEKELKFPSQSIVIYSSKHNFFKLV